VKEMALRKIKYALINLYDRLTAKTATISIGDIINQRTDIENNQFLLTTRLLDIEDFCERGIDTFNWQNTISRKAYGERHREQDGNIAFSKLIKSYRDSGFRLLDGNHRIGMNLYMGIDTINVRILKRKSHNPKALDWYLKVGLDTEFIESVTEKFVSLQKKMMDTGNVFCAVVSDEKLAHDISCLAREVRIDQYDKLPADFTWGGYSLPSRGLLIRFTLHEPGYYVADGKVHSKRVEEIKAVIQTRTEAPVIMSLNCLEGKEIFEVIKPNLKLEERNEQ
jgi:hypothetical protein